MSTPKNGQTHSNNSAFADNCLSVFDPFVRLAQKWLKMNLTEISLVDSKKSTSDLFIFTKEICKGKLSFCALLIPTHTPRWFCRSSKLTVTRFVTGRQRI